MYLYHAGIRYVAGQRYAIMKALMMFVRYKVHGGTIVEATTHGTLLRLSLLERKLQILQHFSPL